MNRLFHHRSPGLGGYAALATFALAYVAVIGLTLAPRGALLAPLVSFSAQTAP